jgi:hypothetical protein
VVFADGEGHLPSGVNAEVQDGVLVSAQDMHALPVVHAPDAQVKVLRCKERIRIDEVRMTNENDINLIPNQATE